ncbi:MAG TPA: hypothetical protein VHA70_05300 [Bauldia sp.]|nr:hypothetical protein [Bauldia sp.]
MRLGVGGRILSLAVLAWCATASFAMAQGTMAPMQPVSPPATTTEPPANDTVAPPPAEPAKPTFSVEIPAVQAVNSSIDEATLRSIFMGDLASHAEELAALKASSIRVPEIRITYTMPEGRVTTAETGIVTLRDVRLQKVTSGVAQAIIVGGVETTGSRNGGTARFGKMSAEDFDIGGLLAFLGVVKGDPSSPKKTLYRNFMTTGGSAASPKVDCMIGPSSVARVSVRPLKVSLPDMLTMLAASDKAGAPPTKEQIATMVDFFIDATDAIETSPMTLGGFACKGTDDDGAPLAVKLGAISVGAFARGRYPDFAIKDIAIATNDGGIGLGEFRFKGFDFSGIIAALKSAAGAIDEDWLQAHYRSLVPPFEGIALSKFALDIPDPDHPGERVKGGIAKFDLTLQDYVNGVPTDIATSASHITALLPPVTSDRQVQALLDYGIDKFDIGFDLGLKWHEDANEVRLDRFSITGADMGSIAAATVIGGATRDLFSEDTETALFTALGLTLKSANVDLKDAGLADIILRAAAKDAKKDVATFRQAVAAFAQGAVVLFLGPAANAQKVAIAIGDFVNGKRSLSVSLKAKDPAGVSFGDLQSAKEDPAQILDKVDLDATAK